jgi:post-segregation antitoxin (ccd killing protein)
MTSIDLTLELPDGLAKEAKSARLLSSAAVARLLRQEIRRQTAGRLLAGAERANATGSRRLPDATVQREIDAVRKDRRNPETRARG